MIFIKEYFFYINVEFKINFLLRIKKGAQGAPFQYLNKIQFLVFFTLSLNCFRPY